MSLLSQPLDIRGLRLPNRIVMPAMASRRSTVDGRVTDDLCTYYQRRAKSGGIGLIITEHAFVHPQGRLEDKQLSIADDEAIPGLRRLTDVIHECGGTVFCQLAHAGSAALPEDLGAGIVSASACVHPGRKRAGNTGMVAHALTGDEIAEIAGDFAAAARRALAAGYDGVEVHAAHGYLLDQFYSPIVNNRDDEYGSQSVENRIRATATVVSAVRAAIGEAPLAVRLGPCDYAEGGATLADGVQAARIVAAAGADLIDVSGGIYNFSTHVLRVPGFFRDASALIRDAIDIPVLTVGGVHTAEDAEWLLEIGACDLVGVGRALMRQPLWAARALEQLG